MCWFCWSSIICLFHFSILRSFSGIQLVLFINVFLLLIVRYDLLLNSATSHLAVNQLLKNQRKDPWVLHLHLCLHLSNWLRVTLSNQRQGCLLCLHLCQFIILFYQRFSQLTNQSECQSLDLIHHLRRKRVCLIINIKNRQYDDVDLQEMSV